MTLTHQTVVHEKGEPTAAIVPWEEFKLLREAYGLDLDEDETAELREALSDSEAGNADAFVAADDV